MLITKEEGLLHLNQWCNEHTRLMVQHFTRDQANSLMVMGEIDSIDGGEIIISIEDAPKSFIGRFRYDDATWTYTEIGEMENLAEYLKAQFPPQTPMLCLGWPESEMLLLQPRPADWDD
ncbi:MAG TPA: hypothetical protein VGU23_08500 [Acidobacteriaceae bacterium]|nr:hypothetical protein [Acidobacteriaceae bacterium]